MSLWLFNLIESVLFVGMLLLLQFFFIPRSIHSFNTWKSSRQDADLVRFIRMVVASFFIFSGIFVIFIRAFIRH